VNRLPPARASLARSDPRVGQRGATGAAGSHPGAARRPLPVVCPVEGFRLADSPRPDQRQSGAVPNGLTRQSTPTPTPWRSIQRTRTRCSGSVLPTGCATSPRSDVTATSSPPLKHGGAPWNSTRTRTSGVAASSSAGRASPSRTRSTSHRLLVASQGEQAESDEVRRLDFEVKVPPTAEGKLRLTACALYNACEESGGRCLFLRQDLTIDLNVTK
jgi:hypothetical protein